MREEVMGKKTYLVRRTIIDEIEVEASSAEEARSYDVLNQFEDDDWDYIETMIDVESVDEDEDED
jgi:hypothetical protein